MSDRSGPRRLSRLALFRLDDAVRDARGGLHAVVRLSKKNTPLLALARYQAEHADVRFEIEQDRTRFVVSISSPAIEPMAS